MKQSQINKYLFGTVFITGAAVLVIEVAAVRVLSPVYGSSLYVLSSVLTIILAALSAGYWYGGRRADKEQSIEAMYSLIAISGISVLVLLLLSQIFLSTLGTAFSPATGPLIFSFLLFFIPAFLLGIISPYVIKLQSLHTPSEKIGSVVGGTFFWGTVGSIVGSLITGFILIPELGVTKTVSLIGILLVIVGLFTPFLINKPLQNKKVTIMLFITAFLSILLYQADISRHNTYVYYTDGLYSQILVKDQVIEGRPIRFLQRDSNHSSAIYLDSKKLAFPYAQFSLFYKKLVPDTEHILVLGGGAYTIPRTLVFNNPDLMIDVVEIEPGLFTLAQTYFDLDDVSHISNFPMDARVFLEKTDGEKYDFIFSDLFGTNHAPPFHLTTYEFNQKLKSHLKEDGVLMLNVIGISTDSSPSFLGSIAKTLSAVFPTFKIYLVGDDPNTTANYMFVARNGDKPIDLNAWDFSKISKPVRELTLQPEQLTDELLLTDDRAPVAYLMSKQQQYVLAKNLAPITYLK